GPRGCGGPAGNAGAGGADGAQQTGAALPCRRPPPYAGNMRDNRPFARLLSPPRTERLGADCDRPGAPGPRRDPAHLPDLCRDNTGRIGAPVPRRVPCDGRRGEPLSGAGRRDLRRGRRDPPRAAAPDAFRDARPSAPLASRAARPPRRQRDRRRLVRPDPFRRLYALQARRGRKGRRPLAGRALRPLRRSLLSAMTDLALLGPDEPGPVTLANETGSSVFF